MDNRVNEIQEELASLNERRKDLLKELKSLLVLHKPERILGLPLDNVFPNSKEGRVDIFLRLFRCREDIYPHYWESPKTGKKGYSPVCMNDWVPQVCKKPKIKCGDCPNQAFAPLNEGVATNHLQGREIIGTYAIRRNNKCIFLAADFDKSSWQKDVMAFKEAAKTIGVETAIEISRSGNGAHAWIFFSGEIPAHQARQLGSLILSLSSLQRPSLSLASYDRFFPNQDVIPKGGFGNLIALPLQRIARNSGNSLFINDSFEPIEDQWEFLTNVKRLSCDDVDFILARNLPQSTILKMEHDDFELSCAEAVMDIIVRKTKEDSFDDTIEIELKDQLYIETKNLPSKVFSSLKRSATFANPEFFKLQRMRFSTWKTPRYIFSGDMEGDKLILPRGNLDFCNELAEEIGAEITIYDQRPKFKRKRIKFIGELRKDQKKAVKEMAKHDFGVLVAPPGVGKTVMGCYMIAKRKLPTLILVHRKPLMEQWVERISEFLDVDPKEIGSYGGTKKKPKGKIDVAMLQTLGKLEDSPEFLSQYGQIIIDECHHIPAVSFEQVLKKIPAKYFLGLTATPVRKDGLQAILHMQCGPIRYEMEEYGAKDLIKKAIIKETTFKLIQENSEQVPIHEIWNELIKSPERLEMIATDLKSCIAEGACPLLVSDRKEHLSLISQSISPSVKQKAKEILLVGDMGKKARKEAFDQIDDCVREHAPFYILSTGSLIGEGVDIPMLDRLILAMPISFKGRLKQYVGRIHRPYEGKKEVFIYDYLDPGMGLTISMLKKRLSAYREMEYKIESTAGSKVDQLLYQRDMFSNFNKL